MRTSQTQLAAESEIRAPDDADGDEQPDDHPGDERNRGKPGTEGVGERRHGGREPTGARRTRM